MKEIKFKAVIQRQDGVVYVSQGYGSDSSFLSYLFDFENNRWDKFLETIITEEKFVKLFPDEYEHLKGWSHIEIVQYSGLYDSDGIEIYEGDIFSFVIFDYLDNTIPYISSVVFQQGSFGVLIKNSYNEECFYELYHILSQYDEAKVIGNIYENKDLLSEVK